MKRFAVAFGYTPDADLNIQIIVAKDWREAALKHPLTCWENLEPAEGEEEETDDDTNIVPGDVDDAKQDAFDNHDALFDIVEILG